MSIRYFVVAETFAAADAATEGSFEMDLISELDVPQATMQILCDSQSTLDFTANQFSCKRSKAFVRDTHFLRDWVARLLCQFRKVLGTKTHADTMTKPLAVGPFVTHFNAMVHAQMIPPLDVLAE